MADTGTAPGLSPAEELRAAADAMSVEADRLDAMDRDATEAEEGSWSEDWCNYRHRDNSVASLKERALIAHRRNTLARDAAVLRATAEMLRDSASNIDCAEADRSPDDTSEITDVHALAVARAFTEKESHRG